MKPALTRKPRLRNDITKKLAEEFKVSPSTICKIKSHRSWK